MHFPTCNRPTEITGLNESLESTDGQTFARVLNGGGEKRKAKQFFHCWQIYPRRNHEPQNKITAESAKNELSSTVANLLTSQDVLAEPSKDAQTVPKVERFVVLTEIGCQTISVFSYQILTHAFQ